MRIDSICSISVIATLIVGCAILPPNTKELVTGPVLTIKSAHARGKGFLISPDGCLVLTAHEHNLMRDSISITPNFGAKTFRRIGLIEDADLALFKLEGMVDLPYLRLAKSSYLPEVGEKLFVFKGSGDTTEEVLVANPVMGFANIKSTSEITRSYLGYRLYGNRKPGDSGLPILNKRGEVIAILFAVSKDIFFGTPISYNSVTAMLFGQTKCEMPS